jgi:hypothetical protein
MSLTLEVALELIRPDRVHVPLEEQVRYDLEHHQPEELCFTVVRLKGIDFVEFKRVHGEDWLKVLQNYGAMYLLRERELSTDIGAHLAMRTRTTKGVKSMTWSMPMGEGKPDREIYTITVRSTGEARSHGKDQLMKLFAPEIAWRTKRRMVFHFFEERHANNFKSALRTMISWVSE